MGMAKEFREFVHRETRSQVDYEISLGPAHVTNLDWLLKAMFTEVVPVDDPTRVAGMQPPLALVLDVSIDAAGFTSLTLSMQGEVKTAVPGDGVVGAQRGDLIPAQRQPAGIVGVDHQIVARLSHDATGDARVRGRRRRGGAEGGGRPVEAADRLHHAGGLRPHGDQPVGDLHGDVDRLLVGVEAHTAAIRRHIDQVAVLCLQRVMGRVDLRRETILLPGADEEADRAMGEEVEEVGEGPAGGGGGKGGGHERGRGWNT